MADYIIDKLQQSSGRITYPITLTEAVKESNDDSAKSLKELLLNYGVPIGYELYSFKVNLNDSNPQTRITYFDMAEGRRPAFWDYTNGYFNFGDWSHAFFMQAFPCMVIYDGTVGYKLNSQNYSLKEDGATSDYNKPDYEGSAMVAFPTIWIKRWSDKNFLYVSICNKQLDEDYHAYMHTNKNGTVCRYKYIGMYSSTFVTDRYKSIADQTICTSQTFDADLQYCHANGENWEMFSWSDFATISDLLTLISKSDNYQKSFGYGYTKAGGADGNNSNGGIIHAGSFYNSAALNTNSRQKVFHLHNIFDHLYIKLGGIMYLNGKLFIKPYPEYNSTGLGYEDLDITFEGTSAGYINKSTVNQYGRFPTKTGGSATTFECDTLTYANSGVCFGSTASGYGVGDGSGKMSLQFTAAINSNVFTNRLTCFSVE